MTAPPRPHLGGRRRATRRPSQGFAGGRGHRANGSLSPPCSTTSWWTSSPRRGAALEDALLQRQAVEERFQVDVFLGDVSWETSYSLPGEEKPPRVRADCLARLADVEPERLPVVVDRRTARRPPRGGGGDHPACPAPGGHARPRRRRRLSSRREPAPSAPTPWSAPRPSSSRSTSPVSGPRFAVETSYQGTLRLDEAALEDASTLPRPSVRSARWVASVLVRLGDLAPRPICLPIRLRPADDGH